MGIRSANYSTSFWLKIKYGFGGVGSQNCQNLMKKMMKFLKNSQKIFDFFEKNFEKLKNISKNCMSFNTYHYVCQNRRFLKNLWSKNVKNFDFFEKNLQKIFENFHVFFNFSFSIVNSENDDEINDFFVRNFFRKKIFFENFCEIFFEK